MHKNIENGNIAPNESRVIKSNNISIEIAPLDSQGDSDNDVSKINIGECEDKLRNYYDIPKNESLLIFKIDIYKEEYNFPVVEYEIYNYKTREKLDLNICNGMKVDLSFHANINEENLDKYDPKSSFYNDVCYTYTSDSGTDVSLKDRKREYVENNLTLCEEDCELNKLEIETQKVYCECKKINLFSISEIVIDKNKLYNSFVNLPTVANLWVMKCYLLY